MLFYDVSEETLMERCLVRASNSAVKRDDDNAETLKKRLQAFKDSSKPVIELYKKFGKVRHIDASESIQNVYEETKKAIFPQVYFALGPHKSGKSTLAKQLCERTNMSLLDFNKFLSDKSLQSASEEDQVRALISYLADTASTRVLIEEFPQTEGRARYFMKNCRVPERVFYIRCFLDECQQRMLAAGKNAPDYLPSAILSKKIKLFNDHAQKLLPFLRQTTNLLELSTDQVPLAQSFKQLSQAIEPTVLFIKSQEGDNQAEKNVDGKLYKEIMWALTNNWGYKEININDVIALENERGTNIGKQLLQHATTGKIIPAELLVRGLLRKVIYSGDGTEKFIITGGFPHSVEQAKEFESSVSAIAAVIYTANRSEDSVIHIN